jgi:hypothetical protein
MDSRTELRTILRFRFVSVVGREDIAVTGSFFSMCGCKRLGEITERATDTFNSLPLHCRDRESHSPDTPMALGKTSSQIDTRQRDAPPEYEQPYSEGDFAYEDAQRNGRYGIMYGNEYKWGPVRCTKEAYGQYDTSSFRNTSRRAMYFYSTWLDAATANECIREIGGYNRFDPAYVTAAIDSIPDTAQFVVGREHSPVIYVWTEWASEVIDIFEESGSEAYDRREELYAELSEIKNERDSEESLILKSPADTSGRLREILTEWNELDTFAPGAPDELGAFPNAKTFPTLTVGQTAPDDISAATPTLIRAWWD